MSGRCEACGLPVSNDYADRYDIPQVTPTDNFSDGAA